MSPASAPARTSPSSEDRAVSRRRPRSGDRRSLPPDSRYRRIAGSGRNRLRVGRSRGADLGEGASPQLAGDAGARHPRRLYAPRSSADRTLRLDRNRFFCRPFPSPASVGRLGIERRREGFTAGQAARLLARAEAGWGRATYGLALGRLHKSYESRAADPDASDEDRADATEKGGRTARVRNWITGLVASLPEPAPDGKVPLQTVVSGVLDFLERTTARSNALDHRAAAALQDYIGELRALGAFSCALSESLRFIRERVSVALRCAGASSPRTSLRVQAFTIRLCRASPPLRRRPRGRARVLVIDRRRRSAGRRTRGDFGRPAFVDGSDRRSRLCGSDPARRIRCVSHVQLFLSGHEGVPRDLRVLADVAGFPAAARGRRALLSPDEGGAWRAEVRRARGPRDCALLGRMVAAQRRRHRRGRSQGPGLSIRRCCAWSHGGGSARVCRVH